MNCEKKNGQSVLSRLRFTGDALRDACSPVGEENGQGARNRTVLVVVFLFKPWRLAGPAHLDAPVPKGVHDIMVQDTPDDDVSEAFPATVATLAAVHLSVPEYL
jgi:hypothetical protein